MEQHIHYWTLERAGTHRKFVLGACGCGATRKFSNGAGELDDEFAWTTEPAEDRPMSPIAGTKRLDRALHVERTAQLELQDRERHSLQTIYAANW